MFEPYYFKEILNAVLRHFLRSQKQFINMYVTYVALGTV